MLTLNLVRRQMKQKADAVTGKSSMDEMGFFQEEKMAAIEALEEDERRVGGEYQRLVNEASRLVSRSERLQLRSEELIGERGAANDDARAIDDRGQDANGEVIGDAFRGKSQR